ncbi:hypothetical protein GCM10023115_52200 [Pontixanthobacter gangjinensis]
MEQEDFNELSQLVESGKFEIENTWAIPLGGGNINLIGNPNSIEIMGDSVEVYLPYFGVRQSGGSYDGEAGIKLKDKIRNLKVDEDPTKGKIDFKFETSQNTENLNFIISLYSNNKARTQVISSQRTSISYDGIISKLEKN